MTYRKSAIVLMVVLFLIPCWAGVGQGKVLEQRKFDREGIGGGGGRIEGGIQGTIKGHPAWKSGYDPRSGSLVGKANPKIVLPVVPGQFASGKGTMILWFYYEGASLESEDRTERIFTVLDNTSRETFYMSLIPAPWDGEAKAQILIAGAYPNSGFLYGEIIAFDRKIPARRWSYVAITWGPEPARDNKVYLNGVPATGGFAGTDLKRPVIPSVAMGPVLAGAGSFYFGGDTQGYDGFFRGHLGEVEFRDEILTAFNYPPRGNPTIKSISDDTFQVPGISGKLVAGDAINVAMEGDPGETASIDFGPVKGIPMSEDPAKPGSYSAKFTVPPGIFAEKERIVGHLADETGYLSEPALSPNFFSVDSRSRFAMTIDKADLPADSAATARVKVKVTDANGNPVKDHRIKVTLSTTDEYTGLVGGGSTRSKDIAAANEAQLGGAEVESRWNGITDSWGEVDFDFRVGFAAKTIILQAKDLTAGDVGVDYITSYKEASIDIALTAPRSLAAARRGLQYIIRVEATRTELTADGRSRSVIRATVLDPNGAPVPGDPVSFTLSSANGTIRTVNGTTDAAGVATAEYTAGKKIGIVVVTALDTARNISGSVSIILLADAPAKIYLKARPESLPADGFSRADLSVKVTDINDNPNRDTQVEFKVAKGGGRVEYGDRTTDQFGDTANRYTSGTTPGIATVLATVRSKVPTDAELAKARNVLFVPYSEQGEDIRVSRWLKRVGETALKGEPIVEYTIGRDETIHALNEPYDCRVDFQYVEYWDKAQTGDTLAQITPVNIPGSSTGTVPATAPSRPPRRR